MNAPMRKIWTQAEFFAWAGAQEERYEFDGFAPVAMTWGSANHNLISGNAYLALRRRLQGMCRAFFEMGVETVGGAVRFPDLLVTCSASDGEAVKVPGPVLVMEVIRSDSGRRDRVEKVSDCGCPRSGPKSWCRSFMRESCSIQDKVRASVFMFCIVFG